jgi:hypothetical protein
MVWIVARMARVVLAKVARYVTQRGKARQSLLLTDLEFDQFSQDGKRLFVLTADQTVYYVDVSKPVPPARRTVNPRTRASVPGQAPQGALLGIIFIAVLSDRS